MLGVQGETGDGKSRKAGQMKQDQGIKIFVAVRELVEQCGVPLDDVASMTTNGDIVLYLCNKHKYNPVANIEAFAVNYRNIRVKQLEREIANINNNPIFTWGPAYLQGNFEAFCTYSENTYGIESQEQFDRIIGIAKARIQKYEKQIEYLNKIENAKEDAIINLLYVKKSDFEKALIAQDADKVKISNHCGSKKPKEIIEATVKACAEVEQYYNHSLGDYVKKAVFRMVQEELHGKTPHRDTFQEWFTNCEFTKKRGRKASKKTS